MFSQACVKNSVHREGCAWRRGNVWQGGVHGGVYVVEVHFRSIVRAGETAGGVYIWHRAVCVQERRPLKRAVCILLECILVRAFFFNFIQSCQ